MAFLPRPVTMMMLSIPEAMHSSTTYWISGLSTTGSIFLGCAFVAGRKRVPSPAAGSTALRTRLAVFVIKGSLVYLRVDIKIKIHNKRRHERLSIISFAQSYLTAFQELTASLC